MNGSLRMVVAVPTNGLVVYCGTVMTEEGREKKVNIDFEPFRPINTSLYLCDNKFHTEVQPKHILFSCSLYHIYMHSALVGHAVKILIPKTSDLNERHFLIRVLYKHCY